MRHFKAVTLCLIAKVLEFNFGSSSRWPWDVPGAIPVRYRCPRVVRTASCSPFPRGTEWKTLEPSERTMCRELTWEAPEAPLARYYGRS